MRRFLYFFPRVPGMNARMLADRGALDRFTRRLGGAGDLIPFSVTGIESGPQGAGCIVAAGSQPPSYDLRGGTTRGRQAWLQGEKFWVGIEDAPPRPEDLVREIGISGYEALLADGCAWRIPLLRRWDETRSEHVSNLPRAMMPATGGIKIAVRPEYLAVDALAQKLFAGFLAGSTLAPEAAMADAASILEVNYRLGLEEIGLLGLVDEGNMSRIFELSIDIPTIGALAAELAEAGLQYADPVIEDE